MLLLASLVSCWGEARSSAFIDQRSAINVPPSQPLSMLWQKADESLKIIEESLIAQGEPVENLSKSLDGIYQKSQELHQSVNALSLRFEYFEEYLTSLDRNMAQAIKKSRISEGKLMIWKTLSILSMFISIAIALLDGMRWYCF
jgi:hypothetical protein